MTEPKLLVCGLGYPTDIPGVLYSGGLDVVVANLYQHIPYRTSIFVRATTPPTDAPIRFAPAPHIRVNAVPIRSYRGKEETNSYHLASTSHDIIQSLDFCYTVLTEHVFPTLLLWDQRATVLHCHDWLTAKAIAAVKRRKVEMPCVFSVHMSAPRPPDEYLRFGRLVEEVGPENPDVRTKLASMDARLLLEAEGCADADVVHCVSNSTAEDIRRAYAIPKSKVRVIYNGVDTDTYHPPTKTDKGKIDEVLSKYGIKPPFVLSSGRFVIEKGHKELIQAFGGFHKQHPEYSLAVFGFGGYTRDELLRVRGALPPGERNSVYVVDADARGDLPHLYRACDIAAFPSHQEAFGLVAVEAAACGKPVVVGDVGGLREVVSDAVDGKIGTRVDGRNPRSIEGGLEAAHQNRGEWGPAAREYAVRNFSWGEVAKQYMDLYRGLVG